MTVADNRDIGTYSFYVFASNTNEGAVQMFSEMITINIVCISSSTALAITNSYATVGLTYEQHVPMSDASNTKFEFPTYTSIETYNPINLGKCPVETVKIV